MIRNWPDTRVTVMGLGRFGGGVGVTRWLAAAGARLIVTDKEPPEQLRASLDEIADLDVTLRLGGHDERDFRDTDLVVVNPAVREESPFLEAARAAGVPITTEINLFVERCPARCIGVTGSVGKSTVTAMIGHVLEAAAQAQTIDATADAQSPAAAPAPYAGPRTAPYRRVWVGGNIGRSLLDTLDRIHADDIVVLELSSFQLQRTPLVEWSPCVAVITNIAPNHLDWHGDFAAYQAAKLNIARFQNRTTDVVIMQDLPDLMPAADRLRAAGAAVWQYRLDHDTPLVRAGADEQRWDGLTLNVPGRHNRENAAAALAVAHALGVPSATALAALTTFEALPHRLQRVAVERGVTYLDDSKSTTPTAALTALRALDAPLLVILGGYDKGSDLRPVAEETARRARFAACIGATGPGLVQAIQAAGGQAELCPDLRAAVRACQQHAQPGDVVLLSPACASWGQFTDYRERGRLFAQLARGESEPTAPA